MITRKHLMILPAMLLLTCVMVATTGAAVMPGAKFSGGSLTMEVKNATLSEVLETIARKAGVDVFVAKGFLPTETRMSLRIVGEPLEDALRQILRGFNYAAIYVKEGEDFRIAALKIYPEGQQGGDVVPLFSGGRTPVYEEKNRRGETITVMVSSGGEVVTNGGLQRKGLLAPSQSVLDPATGHAAPLNTPWFAMQAQLESEEASKYQELMLLQKRLESAQDPALRQSLMMIYADEMAKFYTAKKANLNKIESLKRLTQSREMTGQ